MKRILFLIMAAMLLAMAPNTAMAQKKSAKKTRVERQSKQKTTKKSSGKKENTIRQDDNKVVKEEEIKSVEDLQKTETAFGWKDNQENRIEQVFHAVEQMPQFPGGDAGLMRYLSMNINYPPEAAKNNIQGKVILQFVVEKDGHVGEVIVIRSVDPDLDNEAIRVVKSLPKFVPGRQAGEVVRVWYTLPITFKLTSNGSSGEK